MSAKALFIFPFIVAHGLISFVAFRALSGGGSPLAYGGALLAGLSLFVYFAAVMVPLRARTSDRAWPLLLMSGVGVALASASIQTDPTPLWMAGPVLSLDLVYVFWYSRFGRLPAETLRPGKRLPSVSFADAEGNTVKSDDFRGHKVIYLFFRGNWCPLCMAQIREIAKLYQEIETRGAKMVLVSPQPASHTAFLARRFDAPMTFLVDEGNAVAEQLGIADPGGLPLGLQAAGYDSDTVMPTIVVTNEEGVVLFTDETDNYRVRPEPDVFLAILDGRFPA